MAGLMDLFGGGGGGDYQDPFASNRNSLVGLGLGLMSYPTMAMALRGYEQGAATDSANQRQRMQLAQQAREHALQREFQRQQLAQQNEHFNKTFGLQERQFQATKENPYQIATNPEDEMPYYVPRRPGEATVPVFSKTAPAAPAPSGGTAVGAVPYTNSYGANTPQFAEPQTGGTNIWGDQVAPQAPQATNQYPPGMENAKPSIKKAYDKAKAEASAKANVGNEEDAVKSAKAAAEMRPAVDEAVAAYQDAITAGAIGPNVGSSAGRFFANRLPGGTDAEGKRQAYETSLAKIKALVTAAQNKGEGQVSNFERQMYAQQFPDVASARPEDQLRFLKQLQAATHETVRQGRNVPLGSVAPNLYERPAIARPAPTTAFGVQPQMPRGGRTGGAQLPQGWKIERVE